MDGCCGCNRSYEKIKSKIKSTQIGGKGTMRRRKKNVKFKSKIDKKEKELKKIIEEINTKILRLDLHNYKILRDFLDGLILDYIKDLKRTDINKSSGLRYADINKQGSSFIYKNLFYPIDDEKILLKTDSYKFIINSFSNEGKNLFFKFVNSINSILVKKEYKIDLDSSKYNQKEFNLSLNYFSLDHTKKIHFKDIREKYKQYIENEERDKETTNIHFKLLRNQYDEYLKSY